MIAEVRGYTEIISESGLYCRTLMQVPKYQKKISTSSFLSKGTLPNSYGCKAGKEL